MWIRKKKFESMEYQIRILKNLNYALNVVIRNLNEKLQKKDCPK